MFQRRNQVPDNQSSAAPVPVTYSIHARRNRADLGKAINPGIPSGCLALLRCSAPTAQRVEQTCPFRERSAFSFAVPGNPFRQPVKDLAAPGVPHKVLLIAFQCDLRPAGRPGVPAVSRRDLRRCSAPPCQGVWGEVATAPAIYRCRLAQNGSFL